MKPKGVDELQPTGPDAERVWVGDHTLPEKEQGVLVLGSPVVTRAYAEQWGRNKLDAELKLLDLLPQLPDLQCAWACVCNVNRTYGVWRNAKCNFQQWPA